MEKCPKEASKTYEDFMKEEKWTSRQPIQNEPNLEACARLRQKIAERSQFWMEPEELREHFGGLPTVRNEAKLVPV
jgi:hypothetical protein